MRNIWSALLAAALSLPLALFAQHPLDSILPVRGFCIDVPRPSGVDSFVRFINDELAPRKVNTLFLLVDYHYQFKTHPELIDSFALSHADAKKIVRACERQHIRIRPCARNTIRRPIVKALELRE